MLRAPRSIEQYRVKLSGYPIGDKQNGAFFFRDGLRVIISNGEGWEHVSVSRRKRMPSYEDMARAKSIFFEEEDCVMQLHVPKSEHINHHPYCLHLWRPLRAEIPRPPAIMVGPKR